MCIRDRAYDEGRTLQAGLAPVAVQAGPLRLGLSICYDLRFPELYRALMNPPCDVLCVPAAFTHTTGQAHWELLLRARAVENQCYVLAAAQGGTHPNGRRTWGHSMVVGPWGEVLAEMCIRDSALGHPGMLAQLPLQALAQRPEVLDHVAPAAGRRQARCGAGGLPVRHRTGRCSAGCGTCFWHGWVRASGRRGPV